jgi:hypothetical protein
MNAAEILPLFDRQMRREAAPEDAGMRIEREGHLTRAVGPGHGPEDCCILWSGLSGRGADAQIAAERARADRQARAIEWKVYGHDRPADLGARLTAHGFAPDEPETLVCFDLSGPLPAPPAHRVRRIGAADLHLLAEVKRKVSGEDASGHAAALARTMAEMPERLSVYLAADSDGRPAAVGWLRKPPEVAFASLWGGSTMPHLRGRGFYRALVAARLTEARAAGYAYALVEARETSRPILERIGFVPLTSVRGYIWTPERS